MSLFMKDPSAVLDYAWDWSAWLADGETITSATVTAPAGLTIDSQSHDDTTVTAWCSGGLDRTRYTLVCRVVTNQGREDDRSLSLDIKNR